MLIYYAGASLTFAANLIDGETDTAIDGTLVTAVKVIIGSDWERVLSDPDVEVITGGDVDYVKFSLTGTTTADFEIGRNYPIEVKAITSDGREDPISKDVIVFRNSKTKDYHG